MKAQHKGKIKTKQGKTTNLKNTINITSTTMKVERVAGQS